MLIARFLDLDLYFDLRDGEGERFLDTLLFLACALGCDLVCDLVCAFLVFEYVFE